MAVPLSDIMDFNIILWKSHVQTRELFVERLFIHLSISIALYVWIISISFYSFILLEMMIDI